MRTIVLNVLFFLAFACLAAVPGESAAAAAGTDFISWALDRSDECDARWSLIASGGAEPAIGSGDEHAARDWMRSPGRTTTGAKLSHSVVTTRSFINKTLRNDRYLPLSARKRNGASRGVARLKSPAQAHLAVPYSVRRPLTSSIERRKIFRDFGTSITRPRLDSFGRMSRDRRLHNGAVSRPAYRAARPRIL
jgi:hypothetical protein